MKINGNLIMTQKTKFKQIEIEKILKIDLKDVYKNSCFLKKPDICYPNVLNCEMLNLE